MFRFDCAVLRRCAYVLVLLSQTWLENVLMRCQDVSSDFTLLNVEPALSDSLMTQPGFERTCGLQKPWMQTFYCSNLPVPPILWNRKQQTWSVAFPSLPLEQKPPNFHLNVTETVQHVTQHVYTTWSPHTPMFTGMWPALVHDYISHFWESVSENIPKKNPSLSLDLVLFISDSPEWIQSGLMDGWRVVDLDFGVSAYEILSQSLKTHYSKLRAPASSVPTCFQWNCHQAHAVKAPI